MFPNSHRTNCFPHPPALAARGNRSHPTVLGYLLGPTLGASLFSLTHRSIFRGNPAPFEVMDRAFFEHIKRNRVSPVFQSVNNPSPDYYGEKVSAGLRR